MIISSADKTKRLLGAKIPLLGVDVEVLELDGELLVRARDIGDILSIPDMQAFTSRYDSRSTRTVTNTAVWNSYFREFYPKGELFLTEFGMTALTLQFLRQCDSDMRRKTIELYALLFNKIYPTIREKGCFADNDYSHINEEEKLYENSDSLEKVLPLQEKYFTDCLEIKDNMNLVDKNDIDTLLKQIKCFTDTVEELRKLFSYNNLCSVKDNCTEVPKQNTETKKKEFKRSPPCEGSITAIAKEYGKTGKWLNEFLCENGVQINIKGKWYLSALYLNKGYAFPRKGSRAYLLTWTEEGRQFIRKLLATSEITTVPKG